MNNPDAAEIVDGERDSEMSINSTQSRAEQRFKNIDELSSHNIWRQSVTIVGIFVLYLLMGIITFHLTMGWDFINSVYFIVITFSTVGYGDLDPKSEKERLFTSFYLLVGLIAISAFLSTYLQILSDYNDSVKARRAKETADRMKEGMKKSSGIFGSIKNAIDGIRRSVSRSSFMDFSRSNSKTGDGLMAPESGRNSSRQNSLSGYVFGAWARDSTQHRDADTTKTVGMDIDDCNGHDESGDTQANTNANILTADSDTERSESNDYGNRRNESTGGKPPSNTTTSDRYSNATRNSTNNNTRNSNGNLRGEEPMSETSQVDAIRRLSQLRSSQQSIIEEGDENKSSISGSARNTLEKMNNNPDVAIAVDGVPIPEKDDKDKDVAEIMIEEWNDVIEESKNSALMSGVFIILIVLIGTFAMVFIEGWDSMLAFYWACQTVTTVGYGDTPPNSRSGKIFTIFYIVFGVGFLATCVGNIVRYPMNLRERHIDQKVLNQFSGDLSSKMLKSLFKAELFQDVPSLRRDQEEISKAEFVLLVLEMMNKVDEKDILLANKIFAHLDANGDGTLNLIDMQVLERKAEQREVMAKLEADRLAAEEERLSASRLTTINEESMTMSGLLSGLTGRVSRALTGLVGLREDRSSSMSDSSSASSSYNRKPSGDSKVHSSGLSGLSGRTSLSKQASPSSSKKESSHNPLHGRKGTLSAPLLSDPNNTGEPSAVEISQDDDTVHEV